MFLYFVPYKKGDLNEKQRKGYIFAIYLEKGKAKPVYRKGIKTSSS
jgi:hypothetical protein